MWYDIGMNYPFIKTVMDGNGDITYYACVRYGRFNRSTSGIPSWGAAGEAHWFYSDRCVYNAWDEFPFPERGDALAACREYIKRALRRQKHTVEEEPVFE